MSVLVDTSVWSIALRRKVFTPSVETQELQTLIEKGQVQIIGLIRQEILSGIRHRAQFELLKNALRPFPDLLLFTEDYEMAASYFNHCRSKGIQGSLTDFLICAVAAKRKLKIFTHDSDFSLYQHHLPIVLHRPR